MDINGTNETINLLIHDIHQKDYEAFFKKVDELLETETTTEENIVRVVANVLRIFLLKEESSFNFIKKVTEILENDYEVLMEYDSIKISHTILSLECSKLSKTEAVNKLLELAQKSTNFKDKSHAMCYLGTLILSSGNIEENEQYFEELEKLKEDEEYIVDNLNFDKVTTRFNYDDYETLIKIMELRLQNALDKEETQQINELLEEIIITTDKLKDSTIDDYERITLYSLAKMSANTGYIDLEEYFMKLYNEIKELKGYVLESYYDYLLTNYPIRLENDFAGIAKLHWDEHYQNDTEESKKAFLLVLVDYITSFGKSDFELEEILNEIDSLKNLKQ